MVILILSHPPPLASTQAKLGSLQEGSVAPLPDQHMRRVPCTRVCGLIVQNSGVCISVCMYV